MNSVSIKRSWKSRIKYGLASGMFVFSYFIAALSPLAPFLMAETASAAVSCVNDTSGANDEPGQKDLTQMCVDYAGQPTTISTTWNWDELGTSGANTLDACNLFDTDNDGNVNYAVCVTTQGNPASVQSVTTYSCGDAKPDRCTQQANVIANGTTSCSVAPSNTDPFPAGTQSPLDIKGSCTIDLSKVGGNAAKLIDVCSYPSQQPNSDPSDCVVFVTAKVAQIEVIKDIVSANPSGLFNLSVDGPSADDTTTVLDRGDNGTTGIVGIVLPQGNNFTATVSETAGTGTSLSNYASSISCVTRGTSTVVASGSATSLVVPISDGSNIVCTITNRQNGSITIIKDASPNSSQVFDFTATNVPGTTAFTLVDDGTAANTRTFTNLQPGTYGFAELAETGWDLTGATCTDQSPVGAVVLAAGENVTCTFSNAQRGQLIVQKTTLPAGNTQSFAINASTANGEVVGSASGSVTDANDYVYTVKLGTYSVAETVPTGWEKTGDTCQGVVVAPGETKYCTLTNTKLSTITINKNALPNALQDFNFTATGDRVSNFVLDDDSGIVGADSTRSNQRVFNTLLPGTYTFSEAETSGWDFAGFQNCTTGNITRNVATRTVSIELSAGESISCTFNNRMHGQLVVRKATFPTGSQQQFAVTGSSSNGGLFFGGNTGNVTDAADKVFSIQQEKTYSVAETVPEGWSQTSNNCQNLSVDSSAGNLVNGVPTVYCDIVNTKLAGLTVTKQTDPNGDASMFDFTDNTGQGNGMFQLGDGGSKSFTDLTPGATKTVSETGEDGWRLTSIVCDEDSAVENIISQSVAYTPTPGQSANCTFTNTKLGSISGVKWNDLDGNGVYDTGLEGALDGWTINLTGTNMLGESVDTSYVTGTGAPTTGGYTFADLLPGTYSVSEVWQSGWVQTSSPEDHTVNLVAGTSQSGLNFGNQAQGTIRVLKTVDNGFGDKTTSTDWTWDYTGANLYAPNPSGSNVATGAAAVTVGADTYSLHEDQKPNYHFTSVSCKNDGQTFTVTQAETLNVTVGAGDDIVCTFVNTRDTGTIKVLKNVDDGFGNITSSTDWTWDYTGANLYAPNPSGSNVATGADAIQVTADKYTINEDQKTNYHFTSVSCTNDGQPFTVTQAETLSVTVQEGNDIVCTFLNTRDTANITVTKVVTSDNGGTAKISDFPLYVNATQVTSGETKTYQTGVSYTVSETLDPALGYEQTSLECIDDETESSLPSSFTLLDKQNVTCTITNNDKKPSLTLVKEVTNDNGGTRVVSEWTLDAAGATPLSGKSPVVSGATFEAGTYALSETGPSDYTASQWSCEGGTREGSNITVSLGQSATCTITNNDKAPSLTLVKKVSNNFGGLAVAGDWTLTATGPTPISGDGQVSSGGSFDKGVYTLSESRSANANPNHPTDYYTASVWSCEGGSLAGSVLTVKLGENVTCEITNSDTPASIFGTKFVSNVDMSWATEGVNPASGWTIFLDQNQNGILDSDEKSTTTDSNGNYSFTGLIGGITYYVKEVISTLSGWMQVGGNPAPVSPAMGESVRGVNFTNKAYGTLTVIKNVVDENGQTTENANGWTWNYNGLEKDGDDLEADKDNKITVPAGSYSVIENAQDDYTVTASTCSGEENNSVSTSKSVLVSPGENVVCTFTNIRDSGGLIVKKIVINDDNGDAEAADFTLHVKQGGVDIDGSSFAGSESGTTFDSLATGTYSVSEDTPVTGYEQTSIVCNGQITATVTVSKDTTKTCVITNDDIAPKLTVVKHVNNGYTNLDKVAADFEMNVSGTNVSDPSFPGSETGTIVTLNQGAYNVTEGNHEGYVMTTEGACSGTIKVGDEKTCTITNTAIENPKINIVKDGPDQAHEGDTVTYAFVVTNPGNVPLSYVDVVDNIAGEAEYVMGDSDNDQKLDPGETWNFTVDYVIPDDQEENVVNTATVCGEYGGRTEGEESDQTLEEEICDNDTHTLDVLHPSITVEKTGPANLLLGSAATYTFTVKNTGDTPLDLTKVLDDLAGTGTYVSGDTDNDDLLDLAETWVYIANYTPTAVGNVVNTVEVCAEDELEGVVCDEDDHTTIVYVPQVLSETTPPVLRDTGTPLTFAWIASATLLGLAIFTQLNLQRTQKWLAAMRAGFAQPFTI